VEPEVSLSPENASGTQDHVETETVNLLKPIQEGSNPTEAVVSPGTNRLGQTSASRPGALIDSLREDLLTCPLEALKEILPEGSSSVLGIGSQEELVEAILHAQLQVSCSPNFSYPLFSTSYLFYFLFLFYFYFFFKKGYNKDGCPVANPPGSFCKSTLSDGQDYRDAVPNSGAGIRHV
jgi:hypothetical protein